MRQHRLIALLIALAAAVVIPASGVGAMPADKVTGPSCGDIVLSNQDFSGPPLYSTGNPKGSTPATLYAELSIDGGVPSCARAVYTIYVYSTDASGGNRTFLTSQTYFGDGTTSDFGAFTYQPPNADTYLCVYAQSFKANGNVIDTAPNDACDSFGEPIVLDGGSPGGQGYF